MSNKFVYIVSDALGQTGEKVLRAAALQFNTRFLQKKFRQIRTPEQVDEILEQAKAEQALIVYTLVIPQLNDYLKHKAISMGLNAVDILASCINALSELAEEEPHAVPMLGYELDEGYFKKIFALEFTSRNDDGQHPEELKDADVVLLGVSRVSKTPLSYFLASNEGLKVSNLPLIPGVEMPAQLYELPPNRVFGLYVSPERLQEIRIARSKKLATSTHNSYSNLEKIYQEVEFSLELYKKLRCQVIDMSRKNIEEAATDIIERLAARGLI